MPKSNLNFLRVGLPFFAIVVGSAFGLHYFQQVRFEYSKVKKERDTVAKIHDSLEKAGVKVRKNLTVEDIYQEIAETDTDNWENIRGPRRRSPATAISATKTMMVSSPRDPNFLPNAPIINDPQEPIDPPSDRNARNSVPPLPDFSHPDTPGPSRNIPAFGEDETVPDPTTESQSSYVPNEPSLPQENPAEHEQAHLDNLPAEPQQADPSNLPAEFEPQQPSSSSNDPPIEPHEVVQDDPTEPEQNNDDPFDPEITEQLEANSSCTHSSHPSDPN